MAEEKPNRRATALTDLRGMSESKELNKMEQWALNYAFESVQAFAEVQDLAQRAKGIMRRIKVAEENLEESRTERAIRETELGLKDLKR